MVNIVAYATAFIVLGLIVGISSVIGKIFQCIEEKRKLKEEKAVSEAVVESKRDTLLKVALAAVAVYRFLQMKKSFGVPIISRPSVSRWVLSARRDFMMSPQLFYAFRRGRRWSR